ncbi:hypothetical protein [Shewanella benthica]|nr:hypothetical protein [Shewanella benthica]
MARKQTSTKANRRSTSTSTDEVIRKCLQLNWSPLAISLRIEVELEADDMLSHTTIYRRIEDDRRQGGTLYRQLPRYGKTR